MATRLRPDTESIPSAAPAGRHLPGLGYLPGLDGLRAVAVLAVMLYHGGITWTPGGLLGVDIFFVLSGYLITTLLLREIIGTGHLAFGAFYLRRARRLFPALLLLLVGVAIYGYVTPAAERAASLRVDALAALAYVANWSQIWGNHSYFAQFGPPSPLRHVWSLAVEEQWYLFWPPVLLGLLTVFRRRIEPVLAVVVVLMLGSAFWMSHLVRGFADPSRAYYGTDTRAQSLLVGAALALVLHRWPVTGTTLKRLLAVAGVVAFTLCVAAMTHYSGTTGRLYHGGFLVFSLLTAVAVATLAVDTRSPLSRLLSIRPLPWIGRISYGLYLWHWLIDVWLNADRVSWGVWPLFAVRTALAFAVATASYYLVERPVRNARWNHLQRPRIATVGGLVSAAALVALLCWGIGPGLDQAGADQVVNQLAHPDPRDLRVLVVGDSVAWSLGNRVPKLPGLAVLDDGRLGCGVLPGTLMVGNNPVIEDANSGCPKQPADWARDLRYGPDVVLASWGAWEVYDHLYQGRVYRVPSDAYRKLLVEQMTARLDFLRAHTTAPIVLLDMPCANEPQYRIGDGENPRDDVSRVDWFNSVQDEVVAKQPHQVSVLRWSSWLCPGRHFLEFETGVKVRPDGLHFQHDTAPLAWDWLTPRLDAVVKASRSRTR